MEGAERIMLGSNNYLGLTGDERVIAGARDALDRYGTGLTGSRLLNGTIDLHLELEREIAEWMGTEDAIVFTTGHQANVGTLGTLLGPGDTVIADSADHASILDGCLLSRAKLRPFRHGRLDKLEKMLERAAEDGGGVLVVVDGVFSMEGDVADLPRIVELCRAHGARLMVDEAARRRRARRARRRRERAARRRGRRRPADGHVLQGARLLRRLHRRHARGRSTSCGSPRAPSCSPPPPCPAAVGAALAALRIVRSEEGPQLFARVLENAAYLRDGPARPRLPGRRRRGITTPIVPVVVGDDWKAVLLWRALYDAGVYVNVALHPAVPPAGALLRTSVMATHDRETLDRALAAFADVKRDVRGRARPAARAGGLRQRSVNSSRIADFRSSARFPAPPSLSVAAQGEEAREITRFLRMQRVVERCIRSRAAV